MLKNSAKGATCPAGLIGDFKMIGKTISHYRILEEIGRGGMGVVYKAQDLKLDRFVALKFLLPHLGKKEEEKDRYIHEAKAASALQHNNEDPEAHDACEETSWFRMEQIE